MQGLNLHKIAQFFIIKTCHLGTHFLGTHCRLDTPFLAEKRCFKYVLLFKNQILMLVIQIN